MPSAPHYNSVPISESGFGRYDIMLEPRTGQPCTYDAVIIEFKVQAEEEKELSDTVQATGKQQTPYRLLITVYQLIYDLFV